MIRHSDLLIKLDGSKKVKGIVPVLTERNFPLSDYFIESSYIDGSGKTNKCYDCTKMGCEFLANKFTGEKGIIFTAKYVKRFNELERGQAIRTQGLSPQLQLLINMELKQKQLEEGMAETQKEVQAIKDVITLNPRAEWRKKTNKILCSIGNKIGDYKTPRDKAYEALKNRGRCRPSLLLSNLKQRATINGLAKSKVDDLNLLDVLENEPRLREIYITIVKEMAIKYGVA